MAKTNGKAKEITVDVACSVVAGLIVAFGIYCFSTYNTFVPGGLTGVAVLLSRLTGINEGYFMIAINVPLFILASIFVERKLGVYLTIYMVVQSVALILLKKFEFPFYYVASEGNLIFAAIATGVVSGIGYVVQIRRHGASGGTYAISALIRKKNPATNVAWVTFIMDGSVVVFASLYYRTIEAAIATLISLFIANFVVDVGLQGTKAGYRFEIVTDNPDKMAAEIIELVRHGVTEMSVRGMYSGTDKTMLVCIVRRREMGKMMTLLKKYPGCFASVSKSNEVIGRFHK